MKTSKFSFTQCTIHIWPHATLTFLNIEADWQGGKFHGFGAHEIVLIRYQKTQVKCLRQSEQKVGRGVEGFESMWKYQVGKRIRSCSTAPVIRNGMPLVSFQAGWGDFLWRNTKVFYQCYIFFLKRRYMIAFRNLLLIVSHSVLPVLTLPYWSFQSCISLWKSPSALIWSFVVDWAWNTNLQKFSWLFVFSLSVVKPS